jgi:endo-1,4-beta-xylanase
MLEDAVKRPLPGSRRPAQGACTRRQFLTALTALGAERVLRSDFGPLRAILAAENTLRDLAAQKGLLYGCATSQDRLTADPAFAQLVVEQCSLLVPENALNWKYTEAKQGQFDFHMGDWLAGFAKNHQMKFGGGTIVWHQDLPPWFSNLTPADARKVLQQHVTQTVSHFRGRAYSWALVNEAKAFRGSGKELKDTPFLQFVGPDYIETSFRAAAAADPDALLIYNENHVEYDVPEDEYGRTTLLKLLKRLLANKVPIGALGIQSHLRTGGVPFNAAKFRDFLRQVSDMGLKIVISELDVTEKGPESQVADRDRAVANEISRYLNVVLQEKAVIAVVTWGISSRYSWLTNYAPRADGQQVRPLPYDSDLHPTQAWQALAGAFEQAPKR